MTAISGDPGAILTHGRVLAAYATSTDQQSSAIGTAISQVAPSAFTGPAGDRVRSYLASLQGLSGAAAQAFDRVASQVPRVAEAIEEAQADEQAMVLAQTHCDAARAAEAAAEIVVVAADAEMTAADAGMTSASAASTRFLAAVQALQAARQKLQQAQAQLEQAQTALRQAQHRFEEANQHREACLRTFVAVCHEAEVTASGAIPDLPTANSPLRSVLSYVERSTVAMVDAAKSSASPATSPLGPLGHGPTFLQVNKQDQPKPPGPCVRNPPKPKGPEAEPYYPPPGGSGGSGGVGPPGTPSSDDENGVPSIEAEG